MDEQYPAKWVPTVRPNLKFAKGLIDLIEKYCQPHFVMAEIGVWQGESTSWFAANCKTVHGIDPHPDEGVETANTPDSLKDGKPILVRRMFELRCRVHKNIVYHQMTSEMASKLFAAGQLDMVYIDGDHAYKAVKQDILLWKGKIKKGGIIAGHDYNLKGVRQAVTEELGKPIEVFTITHGCLNCER